MKSEKELHRLYKKYINVPIYRVVSSRFYKFISKQGIIPKKDPYEPMKKKIYSLFRIIFNLEKRGFIIILKWGDAEVTGSYATLTTMDDLSNPYVDFSPKKESIQYYMQLKGGAVISNIRRLTKKLIEGQPKLSDKEWKLIKDLNKWANKLIVENKAFYVKGSSESFKTALFQLTNSHKKGVRKNRSKRKYLPSPFGSFEHFKITISKIGIEKYLPRLKAKDFYLRLTEKIPAQEIHWINN